MGGSIETVNEIKLNNLLYPDGFLGAPLKPVWPFVTAIAREYGSRIYACRYILLPDVYACMTPEFGHVVYADQEQGAEGKMQSIESP